MFPILKNIIVTKKNSMFVDIRQIYIGIIFSLNLGFMVIKEEVVLS